MILLTPGPCMTSESVRLAGAVPDMNHREPAFQEVFTDVRRRLLTMYDGMEDWSACLIGGGGTAAVEAMINSCSGERCLALVNGYYSSRKVQMLKLLGKYAGVVGVSDWTQPLDLADISRELKSGSYDTVLVVHNETTTGRLNDLKAIGVLCREHGVHLLVDAMSSFGAEAIDPQDVDAIASSSNKCLHGVAGVSFVLVSPGVLGRVVTNQPPSYYLDLKNLLGATPNSTPPVPAILSLHRALQKHPGWRGRHQEYAARATYLRRELSDRGFLPVIDPCESSVTLTTYHAPPGYSAAEWIAASWARGYLLYGCKGELEDACFQVANMGELSMDNLRAWISVVDDLLR